MDTCLPQNVPYFTGVVPNLKIYNSFVISNRSKIESKSPVCFWNAKLLPAVTFKHKPFHKPSDETDEIFVRANGGTKFSSKC